MNDLRRKARVVIAAESYGDPRAARLYRGVAVRTGLSTAEVKRRVYNLAGARVWTPPSFDDA